VDERQDDDLSELPPPPNLPPPPAGAGRKAGVSVRDWWGIAVIVGVIAVAVIGWNVWQRVNEPSEAAKEACLGLQTAGMLFNLSDQGGRESLAPMMYNDALVGLEADESEIRAAARRVQTAGLSGSGTSLKAAFENFLDACVEVGLEP
jgi:predicted negative regulator of RcsB-dependent stress response